MTGLISRYPSFSGEDLLDAVIEEDLSESLQDVWNKSYCSIGCPAIDRLCSAGNTQDTSQVIELTSSNLAAGKTQLLYMLIANVILSTAQNLQPAAAVVMDTDNRFSIARLRQVMVGFQKRRGHQNSSIVESTNLTIAEDFLRTALRHVHIFRPQSLASLTTTIHNLPEYMFDFSEHHSAHRRLSVIIVDSITAFHWPERLRAYNAEVFGERLATQKNAYHKLIRELQSVQHYLGCHIVATSMSPAAGSQENSRSGGSDPEQRMPRTLLPNVWTKFVTTRLNLSRDRIKCFHVDIALSGADSDKLQRQEMIDRSRFVTRLCHEPQKPDIEGISSSHNRRFIFTVDEAGVKIDLEHPS